MKPVESQEIYLQILQMLAPLRHVYVMGGFAEDALLHHAPTRDRFDIDQPEGCSRRSLLHGWGRSRAKAMYSTGHPLRMAADPPQSLWSCTSASLQ